MQDALYVYITRYAYLITSNNHINKTNMFGIRRKEYISHIDNASFLKKCFTNMLTCSIHVH